MHNVDKSETQVRMQMYHISTKKENMQSSFVEYGIAAKFSFKCTVFILKINNYHNILQSWYWKLC